MVHRRGGRGVPAHGRRARLDDWPRRRRAGHRPLAARPLAVFVAPGACVDDHRRVVVLVRGRAVRAPVGCEAWAPKVTAGTEAIGHDDDQHPRLLARAVEVPGRKHAPCGDPDLVAIQPDSRAGCTSSHAGRTRRRRAGRGPRSPAAPRSRRRWPPSCCPGTLAPRTQEKGPAPGGIDRVGRVVGRE